MSTGHKPYHATQGRPGIHIAWTCQVPCARSTLGIGSYCSTGQLRAGCEVHPRCDRTVPVANRMRTRRGTSPSRASEAGHGRRDAGRGGAEQEDDVPANCARSPAGTGIRVRGVCRVGSSARSTQRFSDPDRQKDDGSRATPQYGGKKVRKRKRPRPQNLGPKKKPTVKRSPGWSTPACTHAAETRRRPQIPLAAFRVGHRTTPVAAPANCVRSESKHDHDAQRSTRAVTLEA